MIRVTELIVVLVALTLLKQYLHTLSHINPQEHVGVANHAGDDSESDSFCDGVCRKVLLAKYLHLEVPLDDESAVETTKDTNDDIEEGFEKVPRAVVGDVEHDELTGPERVHSLAQISTEVQYLQLSYLQQGQL